MGNWVLLSSVLETDLKSSDGEVFLGKLAVLLWVWSMGSPSLKPSCAVILIRDSKTEATGRAEGGLVVKKNRTNILYYRAGRIARARG